MGSGTYLKRQVQVGQGASNLDPGRIYSLVSPLNDPPILFFLFSLWLGFVQSLTMAFIEVDEAVLYLHMYRQVYLLYAERKINNMAYPIGLSTDVFR